MTAASQPKIELSRSTKQMTIYPRAPHTASLIMMHGLGDTAQGWTSVGVQLANEFQFMRVVLPTAPTRPVSLNGGMAMPSWHDILSLDPRSASAEPCAGLDESKAAMTALIDKEIAAGVPANRVIVAGFSQGGALALTTGLSYAKPLGGVIALSGYLPRPHTFVVHEANANTPVLFCHGDADPVVRLDWGQRSAERVKELGVANVTFKVYANMAHSASVQEVADVVGFMRAAFARNPPPPA